MPVTLTEDKVWFDETQKLEQICNLISVSINDGRSVLLLSHFDFTLTSLSILLRAKGIAFEQFSSLNPAELCGGASGKVWVGSTRAFKVVSESSASATQPLDIIIAEHHPMASRDQELIDAAAKLPCHAQLGFYFSLDDPVMKHFGNETIKALFERLGMDKRECISHHLINTAVRAAQEKIEAEVGKDVSTHSATDWFKYNLPAKKQF